MANLGIYQNYLKPPKSVNEFAAEDLAQQQNLIGLQEKRRAMADEEATRAAFASSAGDLGKTVGTLSATGAYKPALSLLEQSRKLQDTEAGINLKKSQTVKHTAEAKQMGLDTIDKQRTAAQQEVVNAPDPEAARRLLLQRNKDGLLHDDLLLTALSRIPDDPVQFKAGQEQMKRMLLGVEKTLPKLETTNLGDVSRTVVRDPVTLQPVGAPVDTPIMPAPVHPSLVSLRASQGRAADAIAAGNTPLGGTVDVGGGFGVNIPAGSRQRVTPNASDVPQNAPLETAASEADALSLAKRYDAAGVPFRINVPAAGTDREISRLPAPVNTQNMVVPGGGPAPLVPGIGQADKPAGREFTPPPQRQGETRNQYNNRIAALERDFESARNRQEMRVTVMGANESNQLNRVLMGGNQTAKALGNIVNLPITASSGLLGGRQQGKTLFEAGKETLANAMTTQEVQSYNTLTTGISRSLAAIESAGLAPSNSLMHMMGNVTLKEGDTNFTKLLKLAETRQVVESGYEVVLANPRVSESQKAQAQSALEEIRRHVPFTPLQVLQLGTLQQDNPGATMRDVMNSANSGTAPKEAIDFLKANPGTKELFRKKYGYVPEGF